MSDLLEKIDALVCAEIKRTELVNRKSPCLEDVIAAGSLARKARKELDKEIGWLAEREDDLANRLRRVVRRIHTRLASHTMSREALCSDRDGFGGPKNPEHLKMEHGAEMTLRSLWEHIERDDLPADFSLDD